MGENISRSYSRGRLSTAESRPNDFRQEIFPLYTCPKYKSILMYIGLARRTCLESGTWEHVVDISDCANAEISNLAEQVGGYNNLLFLYESYSLFM